MIGWDPDELRTQANERVTVQRYNAAVDTGDDADFGRGHPPAPIAGPPFDAVQDHALTLPAEAPSAKA